MSIQSEIARILQLEEDSMFVRDITHLVESEMLSIIGPTEPNDKTGDHEQNVYVIPSRNELRREQRNALKGRLGK